MPLAYYVNVSVHVLAAMVWLGGMLFLAVVGAPVLRGVEAYHDFVIGPRAGAAKSGSEEAARLRRQASWLARVAGLSGIALVCAAVVLARGG